ncbi:hypothetical protein NDU88_001924 [Pleurodeles waltl]|uniref:Uncharacterized protein n=1 Tax=Pleurodeles waltl TaxID=8319 RepID=A0AAV7TKA7_PLEWA|nr:hypothetical protein NDU88_001924 [Pleurodeles waltl]
MNTERRTEAQCQSQLSVLQGLGNPTAAPGPDLEINDGGTFSPVPGCWQCILMLRRAHAMPPGHYQRGGECTVLLKLRQTAMPNTMQGRWYDRSARSVICGRIRERSDTVAQFAMDTEASWGDSRPVQEDRPSLRWAAPWQGTAPLCHEAQVNAEKAFPFSEGSWDPAWRGSAATRGPQGVETHRGGRDAAQCRARPRSDAATPGGECQQALTSSATSGAQAPPPSRQPSVGRRRVGSRRQAASSPAATANLGPAARCSKHGAEGSNGVRSVAAASGRGPGRLGGRPLSQTE